MDCSDADLSDTLTGEDYMLVTRPNYLDVGKYFNTSGQSDDLPDQVEDNCRSVCESGDSNDDLDSLPDDVPENLSDDDLPDDNLPGNDLPDDVLDDLPHGLPDNLPVDGLDDLLDDLPGDESYNLQDNEADNLSDNLVSYIDEILSSENTGKAVLTEGMLHQLAERIRDQGSLAPQRDHLPQIIYRVILILVGALVGALLFFWTYYAVGRVSTDENESLIDL